MIIRITITITFHMNSIEYLLLTQKGKNVSLVRNRFRQFTTTVIHSRWLSYLVKREDVLCSTILQILARTSIRCESWNRQLISIGYVALWQCSLALYNIHPCLLSPSPSKVPTQCKLWRVIQVQTARYVSGLVLPLSPVGTRTCD